MEDFGLDIRISYDLADHITVKNLMDMYSDLDKQVKNLESMDSLESYEKEDLKDAKKHRKATKKVLSFLMTNDDFDRYIGEFE